MYACASVCESKKNMNGLSVACVRVKWQRYQDMYLIACQYPKGGYNLLSSVHVARLLRHEVHECLECDLSRHVWIHHL